MDKKQFIQHVALDLFIKKGFINTPVRDIIGASGFGTSTFYRYLKNKPICSLNVSTVILT